MPRYNTRELIGTTDDRIGKGTVLLYRTGERDQGPTPELLWIYRPNSEVRLLSSK